MESLGCIWFDRSEAKDHEIVARKYVLVERANIKRMLHTFKSVETLASFFRLRDHVNRADNNPLLIFPEGTCVNNQYSVMFKKVIVTVLLTILPESIQYIR